MEPVVPSFVAHVPTEQSTSDPSKAEELRALLAAALPTGATIELKAELKGSHKGKGRKVQITLPHTMRVCARWGAGTCCGNERCRREGESVDSAIRESLTLLGAGGGGATLNSRSGHGNGKICVVGDSHSRSWTEIQRLLPWTDVARNHMGGMSAFGLSNRESRTQAAKKILALSSAVQSQYILIFAGQVDVDFLYYMRKVRQPGLTFEEQVTSSVGNLMLFLEELATTTSATATGTSSTTSCTEIRRSEEEETTPPTPPTPVEPTKFTADVLVRKRIILHGVHLPPLDDQGHLLAIKSHCDRNGKLGQEHEVENILPPHRERTLMAIQFNNKLRNSCTSKGFSFVDIANVTLDPATGLVKDGVRKTGPRCERDTHLEEHAIAPLYVEAYKELGLDFTANCVWPE